MSSLTATSCLGSTDFQFEKKLFYFSPPPERLIKEHQPPGVAVPGIGQARRWNGSSGLSGQWAALLELDGGHLCSRVLVGDPISSPPGVSKGRITTGDRGDNAKGLTDNH